MFRREQSWRTKRGPRPLTGGDEIPVPVKSWANHSGSTQSLNRIARKDYGK